MHAGALEYRSELKPDEVRRAAGIMRENAHDALQDLREVVGVLRASALDAPQPTLQELRELVDQTRAAGTRATLRVEVAGEPPEVQQRTVYRIVQEGLTNARKHAAGADIDVSVGGGPAAGLTVRVANEAPGERDRGPGADLPSGQGLIGLGERVRHLQGRIDCGSASESGGWELRAWLPWET